MTLRSYTAKEILAAHQRGETICVVNANNQDGDDVLIGSISECRQAVIDNEDGIDVFELWGWTIQDAGEGDYPLYGILIEIAGNIRDIFAQIKR